MAWTKAEDSAPTSYQNPSKILSEKWQQEADDTVRKADENSGNIDRESSKIDQNRQKNRRKIGLGLIWALKAVSGTLRVAPGSLRDALGTASGR